MKIPAVDRSKYLRGLLIVARMDKRISESDKKIITNTAKHLGFSSNFYEEVLNTLLFNQYICNDPVSFETSYLAKHFLTDAIKLACSNKNLCDDEISWFKDTAFLNMVETEWLEDRLAQCPWNINSDQYSQLSVFSFE